MIGLLWLGAALVACMFALGLIDLLLDHYDKRHSYPMYLPTQDSDDDDQRP